MLKLDLINHKFSAYLQRSIRTLIEKPIEKPVSLDCKFIDFDDKPECVPMPPAYKVPLLLIDGTILF